MAEIKHSLLEVDLTKGTSQVVDVTEDAKKYLGGRGLANKLMWEQMPQGADPLGPDNILHVGVGPITGLMGTKVIFSFKAPLTGWAGRGAASGYFGEELVKAQYNAGILIKGKASKPVYLYVYDDKVEIRDASDLWGKFSLDTEVTLRDRLYKETGQMFGVAVIGPAGENMVRFANITTELVHSASKWGGGAVMGSKNLKAIAVRGTKGPLYADHQELWALLKTVATDPRTLLAKLGASRYGHTTSIPQRYYSATEAIKNNHLGWHEVCAKSNSLEHELKYHVWSDGCPGCPAACEVPFFKNTDHGAFAGEFRHDDSGAFTANILISFEEQTEINHLEDELGFDGEECGGIVGWAMDLYDNGMLTKEDLGGIDLQWGNVEAVVALMKKIAYRQGEIPNALADGFRRAYPIFGANADKAKYLAWEVHGCGANTQFTRADIKSSRNAEFITSHNGARMGAGLRDGGLTEAATICRFATSGHSAVWGSETEAARLFLNAACGWDLTPEDLDDITLRNYYFGRCVSLREGYYPAKDDYAPQRLYDEPLTDKYGKVWAVDQAEMEAYVKQYYVDTLKLTDQGLPPRDGLQRLGLDFVIPVLDPMKAVG
jgi:aldehyde:ferredoxin oxidoreductase